jgi:hypothetical protein
MKYLSYHKEITPEQVKELYIRMIESYKFRVIAMEDELAKDSIELMAETLESLEKLAIIRDE